MNNGRGSGGANIVQLECESEIGHAIKMKLITPAPQGGRTGQKGGEQRAARCSRFAYS